RLVAAGALPGVVAGPVAAAGDFAAGEGPVETGSVMAAPAVRRPIAQLATCGANVNGFLTSSVVPVMIRPFTCTVPEPLIDPSGIICSESGLGLSSITSVVLAPERWIE